MTTQVRNPLFARWYSRMTESEGAEEALHRRRMRPGGKLRFYEHVHAHRQPTRAVLKLADRSTLWPRVAGGCHPTRETLSAIVAAGFVIEDSSRFGFTPSRLIPPIPHILTSSGARADRELPT